MIRKRLVAPNLFTIFNLFLGFLAIIFSVQERFVAAAWLIIVAAVCDMLDGKIARATRGYSSFGIEFDSLADVVSFGAAPAIMVYLAQLKDLGPFGLVISFTQLAAGAIRLARFNTHIKGFSKSRFFEGMPIPSAATLLCSYVLFSYHHWDGLRLPVVSVALLLMASVLMVSTIGFEAMPYFSFRRGTRNTVLMLLFVSSTVVVLMHPGQLMFPFALIYIFIQLSRALVNHLRPEEEEPVPDISVGEQ
ncbi:MAG: CDP-diacylglycerol--serine O-phosphatidyltransferase [candidate division KSB1 bacterium]|nr:CDP-diacylglycerol--serine O-phosphatidyltransferase [candidate division KSB1 bacterium]MDZ7303140.1 CDP-diacylglycerol--serine O-phosphatidyltransferase [candidate division KSB1 bacterium]MDZ7310121.1 CDP-diacylglycerol--serine O-phosphatidyltransferase [candidate division KSB1 bacterium]